MQTTVRCKPSCVNWILIDSSLRLLRRWHKILLFLVSRILEIDPKQYDWCTIGIPLRLSMQQWSGREGITLNCVEWSFMFLFSRIYFLHYSLTHSHSSGFNVLLMRGWRENSLQTPRQGARRDDQSDVRCCYLRIWLWLSRWGTSSTLLLLFIPQMTMTMMVIKLQLEEGNQAPCGANSLNGFNTLVSHFSFLPGGS